MKLLSRCRSALNWLFRRRKQEADLAEELQTFIDFSAADKERAGLSAPEARRQARLDLGIEGVKEQVREVRSEFLFGSSWQDIRYGCRMLVKNRGFAITAVLTLAIGVASATTVFTFVRAMLFQPPVGVVEPDRVFGTYMRLKVFDKDYGDYRGFAYPQFEALRQVQDVYSTMVWYARRMAVISIGDYADSVSLEYVMGDHFAMLGTVPTLGRAIDSRDDVVGGPPVAMISYELWQSQFGGTADVLGRALSIDGQNFPIIGVAPKSYVGVDLDWVQFPQVWIPLRNAPILNPTSTILKTRGAWMRVLGRLKPGVSQAAAEARLTQLISVVNDPTDKYHPDFVALAPLSHARINPRMRGDMSGFFAVLMTVSVLILLAACFNVGSFLIGQAATRKHEMAVRLALGASRRRLIRQLLTEATILGFTATSIGFLFSVLLARIAANLPPFFSGFQLYSGPSIEPDVLVFALGLGLITTFVFGFIPAVLVSGRDPWLGMKNSRGGSWGGSRVSPRQCVLVLQVTLAVVLAVTGALYSKSLYHLTQLNPGFTADRLLLADVNEVKIPTDQREAFDRALLSQLRTLPGVVSATISAFPPTGGGLPRLQFRIPGVDQESYFMAVELVGPMYFETTGTPVSVGREFTDTPSDQASVIINELLARKLWPNSSPIGKTVETNGMLRQVIGVVPLPNCWDHLSEPDPCVFIPLDTRTTKTMEIKVTTYNGMAETFRHAVRELNPNVLIPQIRTIEDHLYERLSVQIIASSATGVLAALGVVLSAIGCYAVFSSMMKERTKDIALRLALGAPASRLIGHIVMRSVILCGTGVATGTALAVLIATQFEEQLFQVRPADLTVLTGTAVLIIAVAVAATVVPCRIIARTDPASALKTL